MTEQLLNNVVRGAGHRKSLNACSRKMVLMLTKAQAALVILQICSILSYDKINKPFYRRVSPFCQTYCRIVRYSLCYQQDVRNASIKLALANTEDLGAADGANTLCCRSLVLERNRPRIFNLPHLPALHAVCLHGCTSFVVLPSRVANIAVFVNTRRLNQTGQNRWSGLLCHPCSSATVNQEPILRDTMERMTNIITRAMVS